jgi:hypothetical protein
MAKDRVRRVHLEGLVSSAAIAKVTGSLHRLAAIEICRNVKEPVQSESIEVPLNQDNKSQKGRKDKGAARYKRQPVCQGHTAKTCAEPKRPVSISYHFRSLESY